MNDAAEFGTRIGRMLAEQRAVKVTRAAAARAMISAVIAEHPRVKLPELLGVEEVRDWMQSCLVSESALRIALTAARKKGPAETAAAVRVPRGRPKKAPKPSVVTAEAVARKKHSRADGLVPNGPISDL